jgi:hypothetical protein
MVFLLTQIPKDPTSRSTVNYSSTGKKNLTAELLYRQRKNILCTGDQHYIP